MALSGQSKKRTRPAAINARVNRRPLSPKLIAAAKLNGKLGGRPRGATIANGAKRPGCPTLEEIEQMRLREPDDLHPLIAKAGRYAVKRIFDVMAGSVGSKAAPHVLRAAIHMREECVGPVVQELKLGVSHSMLLAQVEESLAADGRVLTHGDPEGKALLAEFAPVEKLRGNPITDPVVVKNYVPRRSDFDPQVAMADAIERMADREARRRNLTIDQIIDMPFADPDRRNPSGDTAEE
jgi:hypothetical protein